MKIGDRLGGVYANGVKAAALQFPALSGDERRQYRRYGKRSLDFVEPRAPPRPFRLDTSKPVIQKW